MAEPSGAPARPTDTVGRSLHRIARALAVFGGMLSCVMAVVVTTSVTGRYLFSWPVPGDYDIVGILCGSAVFSFLPYCQLRRGNVVADFFTQKASNRTKAALDAFGNAVFLVAAIMFTWRLFFGMLELRHSGEQIAAFPFYRWWTIPFDLVCMVVTIGAILYSLLEDIAASRADKALDMPIPGGE
jgi:TRAP-type C4-dicarboxylate transport system permease small subunit